MFVSFFSKIIYKNSIINIILMLFHGDESSTVEQKLCNVVMLFS